jgi:uncharacterized lipoprotein YddW (UPF0748 family)
MRTTLRRRTLMTVLIATTLLGLAGCSGSRSVKRHAVMGSEIGVPDIPREFRGVWVATVANIDWPSTPGLSTQAQQDELIEILDRCVAMNFNAVVLQVRPTADALYASDLEPWSYYLTGEMGKAPKPFYDPLAFAVREAHARGLELHTWFNPYRALHPNNKGKVAENHISKTHPEVVHEYGPYLWMDPSEPVVQQHSLNVILDVVRRYDIDGVHLDDYFYPYIVQDDDGNDVPFPDDRSWNAYKDSGGRLGRSDWRRKSVDDFIKELYKQVKQTKPHVQVGISPFGIWKPGYPEHIKGFNQYEGLYADAKLWLNKGWIDYFTPQLYWEIDKPDQSFTSLLRWWVQENRKGRHVWPGIAPYRTGKQFDENEIQYQIKWSRIITPESPGTVHFSMRSYMDADGPLPKQILETVYAKPALAPASPWLGKQRPAPPVATLVSNNEGELTVRKEPEVTIYGARLWVVQVQQADTWTYDIIPATQRTATIKLADPDAPVDWVVVSTVSRTGVQSAPTTLLLRLNDLLIPVEVDNIVVEDEVAEEAGEDAGGETAEQHQEPDQEPATK